MNKRRQPFGRGATCGGALFFLRFRIGNENPNKAGSGCCVPKCSRLGNQIDLSIRKNRNMQYFYRLSQLLFG